MTIKSTCSLRALIIIIAMVHGSHTVHAQDELVPTTAVTAPTAAKPEVQSRPSDTHLIPSPQTMKVLPGTVTLSDQSRIIVQGKVPEIISKLLKEDLERIYGLSLHIVTDRSARPNTGDIVLKLGGRAKNREAYSLNVGQHIVIETSELGGFHAGTATLLQLGKVNDGKPLFPSVKITDQPYRALRAVMIDVKNHWHSPEVLRAYIDLCRFYKIRYLSLHTGEGQWIGAITNQLDNLPAEKRKEHRLYTKGEMDALIQYASERGVYLFPHNECTPHFGHMRDAMTHDFVPGDEFAGFPDELDGNGPFKDYEGKPNDRWMNLMKIAKRKAIAQFAAGFPDGKLPFYHVGPVLGEGGMSPELAVQFLDILQTSSPKTKMMFWNGPSATSGPLFNRRRDCVVMYYDDEFGQSDMRAHVEYGWPTVNSAWSPLYVVGENIARPVDKVFSDWNYYRQGSDGVPGGYSAITWEQLDPKQHRDQLVGGMLCTWEVPEKVHLARLRTRVPAFVEHAWNHRTHPYPADSLNKFLASLEVLDDQFTRYIGCDSKAEPSAPTRLSASEGTKVGKVLLDWRAGGANAKGFRIFRSKSNDFNQATKIAELPRYAQSYLDAEAKVEEAYYYWVQAFNDKGQATSGSVSGTSGSGLVTVYSYEPFHSFDGQSTEHEQASGYGWSKDWSVFTGKGVTKTTLLDKSLTYGDLQVSGGSLLIQPTVEKQSLGIRRDFLGNISFDGSELWISYLFRANKIGPGDAFMVPHGEAATALGKIWGTQFGIYTTPSGKEVQPGKTYWMVARIKYGEGDKLSVWINPRLDKQPDPSKADMSAVAEIGSKKLIQMSFQGYGLGEYVIDEIRLGPSFSAVGGRLNAKDRDAPNPDPMTWIAPPSQQPDSSVFMQCVEAQDPSGVQYYFECIKGDAPDSGWQYSNRYTLKGLAPGTYAFRVKTRDMSVHRNEAGWSFAGEVTVQ